VPMDGEASVMRHEPIEEGVADWRALQQCDRPVDSYRDGIRRSSASCPGGREVGLIVVDGLTHVWPISASGLNGARTLWEFFDRHHR
jgi:poly(3-hydroxybutyrate) depolymerase